MIYVINFFLYINYYEYKIFFINKFFKNVFFYKLYININKNKYKFFNNFYINIY